MQQEELVLSMMSVLEAAGASLATPIGVLRMDPLPKEKQS
jgi:hypothetical protein